MKKITATHCEYFNLTPAKPNLTPIKYGLSLVVFSGCRPLIYWLVPLFFSIFFHLFSGAEISGFIFGFFRNIFDRLAA